MLGAGVIPILYAEKPFQSMLAVGWLATRFAELTCVNEARLTQGTTPAELAVDTITQLRGRRNEGWTSSRLKREGIGDATRRATCGCGFAALRVSQAADVCCRDGGTL